MSTAASSLPVDALKFLRTTFLDALTHWGLVTHICVGKPITIGSDSGLSPERRQAIIWTNAGILLIGPLGTNFSEILTGIQIFSLKKNPFENVVWKMASILYRSQCVKWQQSSRYDDRFVSMKCLQRTNNHPVLSSAVYWDNILRYGWIWGHNFTNGIFFWNTWVVVNQQNRHAKI